MIEPLETLNAYLNNCFNIVDYFYVPKYEEFTNLSGMVVVLSGEYFDPCIEDISFISKKEDVYKVCIHILLQNVFKK